MTDTLHDPVAVHARPDVHTVYGIEIELREGVSYDDIVAAVAELPSSHRRMRNDVVAYLSDDAPIGGQHEVYLVLSDEERAKGFVRPVRTSYEHLTCGSITTMGLALSETYARDPKFYGATFCVNCDMHRPVGEDGEFVWNDGSGQKVGT